jgi:hypothetical protein
MPYAFLPESDARPTITGKSAESLPLGGTLTVTYSGTVTYAVIAAPGAVTHQARSTCAGFLLLTGSCVLAARLLACAPLGGC